jgi:hypothetical protein
MSDVAEKRGELIALKPIRTRRVRGHVVGRLLRCEGHVATVDYPENPHGPLPARSTVELSVLRTAERREVLLVFEGERSDAPIIVGIMQVEAACDKVKDRPTEEHPMSHAALEGRRVTLEGQDEIVLRCGEASITLRRNGRVVIRGSYLESRARGVNRIRGGSVQVN